MADSSKEVGDAAAQVKSIFIYPLKSCRGISVSEAILSSTGFRWDRQWIVVNSNGRAYTQRVEPSLALVEVELPNEAFSEGWEPNPSSFLVIRAPGMDVLKVPLVEPSEVANGVSVWEWSGSALDEGDEASKWFTKYLGKPSRLVRFNEVSQTRPTDPKYAPGYKIKFSDCYPFLLISQKSLDALNEQLKEPVSINRFRPKGDSMIQIWEKQKKLKVALKDLNQYMASYSVKLIQARQELEYVQAGLVADLTNQSLIDREKVLVQEIHKWSTVEEQVLRQKARVDWIDKGDANTRYFHAQLKIRSSQNSITSICNAQGSKLTDPSEVEAEFLQFYKNLMGSSSRELPCPNDEVIKGGVCLNREEQLKLIQAVTRQEIDHAIRQMPREKTPGVDGIPIEFFVSQWSEVKEDVYAAVEFFFRSGKLMKAWNCTAVTLVPKVPTPNQVKDYRPIACCTTLYKIIAKVITNRLKGVMDKIVGQSQSAFIEGRSISDNILLSHEIFKGYSRKWISPRCVLKVDLKKAYDSLEWRFLRSVLVSMGFPYKMICWIMECVGTVSYSLMINGGLTAPFNAKRGLRQGDPMSPYLFVLAMEYLNRELKLLARNKEFQFHPRCKRMGLVHLCFADDLLLFCRADNQSVILMQNAFRRFSEASGLQANHDKSQVFIAGMNENKKQELLQIIGYTEGTFPFRYLGVPLSTKKITVQECMVLIEKITSRIRCWSARLLSYAGRLQLIKSVIFGMQCYWAQVFILPKKIIEKVESLCRTYLWTGSDEISKKSLVAWDKVCQPQAAGGLSVINLVTWNKVAILKHLWALSKKKDVLWIKWIQYYYIKSRPIEEVDVPKSASWVMRKILANRKLMNSQQLGGGTLEQKFNQMEKAQKFKIHIAYNVLTPLFPKVDWSELILHKGIHPRHKFIVWLAMHHRLSTVDRLRKMKIEVPPECVFCNAREETQDHLFFQCCYGNGIWSRLLIWLGHARRIQTWQREIEWMTKVAKGRNGAADILCYVFHMVIYCIWRDRNGRRFGSIRADADSTVREIAQQVYIAVRNKTTWHSTLQHISGYP